MTRHRIAGYQLSRDAEDRRALRRNLAIALFTHGQIETTIPKAKSVQPFIERIITAARKGDLASRRRVISMVGRDQIIVKDDTDESVTRNKYGEITGGAKLVKKIFDEVAPKYASRPGGYTRIVKLGKHRIGDGTDLCVLQLVGDEEGPQVSGQFSRRRQKANYRVEFAAKARKAKDAPAAPAAETPAPAAE
jgi:large subunit ribosomal protein L17